MPTTDRRDEAGFTLIELMVVVLIIGILIAIAVPAFQAARDRASDRGAQSDLRTGVVNAKSIAADRGGRFLAAGSDTVTATAFAAALNSDEASITWYTPLDAPVDPRAVTVDVDTTGAAVLLYKRSQSGEYFGVAALESGDVYFCRGDEAEAVNVLPGALDADGVPQTGCADPTW